MVDAYHLEKATERAGARAKILRHPFEAPASSTKNQNAETDMSTNPIVLIRNVRLSFPALWNPVPETNDDGSPKPGGKPKFQAVFILDKKVNAKDIAALKAAVEMVRTTSDKLKGQKKKAPKMPIREGSDKAHLDGYGEDVVFITAKSITRPGVVDQRLNPLAESDNRLLPGYYVNARVEAFPYVHPKSGPGISFGLKNVQLLREGETFGNANGPAEEGFEPVDAAVDAV